MKKPALPDGSSKIVEEFYAGLIKETAEFAEIETDPALEGFLRATPDFFRLLVCLSLDERIDPKPRKALQEGVSYFMGPMDLVPDSIYGGKGFMDDLALACHLILRYLEIKPRKGKSLVLEHWKGEGDPLEIAADLSKKQSRWVNADMWDLLVREVVKM